jgi:phosphonate transport system substrate-binding protein
MDVSAQCTPGRDRPTRLRLGFPSTTTLTLHGRPVASTGFAGVGERISAAVGLPVDATVCARYDDMVPALLRKDLDIAIVPSVVYVEARDAMPCLILAGTMVGDGETFYSGYLVARANSGISTPAQLAGRRIAMVESSSASGWLFPMAWLLHHGVDPRLAPTRIVPEADHASVLRAVTLGEADAGATFFGAIQRARGAGVDVGSLRVIGVTGRIPYDAVVVRGDLDRDLALKIALAVQGIHRSTPEGRAALAPLGNIDGFVPSTDAFYDTVRQIRRIVPSPGGRP